MREYLLAPLPLVSTNNGSCDDLQRGIVLHLVLTDLKKVDMRRQANVQTQCQSREIFFFSIILLVI